MHAHKKNDKKCFIYGIVENCTEYRNLDGAGNNKRNPNFGLTNEPLTRIVESAYADHMGEPAGSTRQSARLVSNNVCDQTKPIQNKKSASNIFWLWGQFIDHTFTLIDPDSEQFNISVPKGDPYFDPESTGTQVIRLNRSAYMDGTGINDIPRAYANKLTPFIDASNVYGSTPDRNSFIRLYENGLLKTSSGDNLPVNDGSQANAGHGLSGMFVGGDIRANEHVGLIGMHTLFVREHNHWAKHIKKYNSALSDEEIYQKARIIIEAEMQAITFNEFLPLLFGYDAVSKYSGYDYNVNPQMSNLFSVSAYRLHSLIPSKIFGDLDLKGMFFNPYLVSNQYDLDYIFDNYMHKNCEESDTQFVTDLRNFLFGNPGKRGRELASLNIQRGRDHGLADYNTVRSSLGMKKKEALCDISHDHKTCKKLQKTYDNVNNVDVFIGAVAEDKHKNSMLGKLNYKIMTEQFDRTRKGDRLWYENRLDQYQVDYINKATLAKIIKRNTGLKNIPCDVFVHSDKKD